MREDEHQVYFGWDTEADRELENSVGCHTKNLDSRMEVFRLDFLSSGVPGSSFETRSKP